MNNLNNKICCFTGHRPKSLPWGYKESGVRFALFKFNLKRQIEKLIKQGVTHFVSGMALGFDMIAAEMVLSLKQKHSSITLECALPCLNQIMKWPHESQLRHTKICNTADKITYVSDTWYFSGCMAKRNKYMIDNSTHLIALYNGTAGGTRQTIEMAKNKGLIIHIIKP